jgi:BioD-like phosphotransacetylase family protein
VIGASQEPSKIGYKIVSNILSGGYRGKGYPVNPRGSEILPSSNIISKAQERNIPMLLVPQDTYQVATNIDNLEILLTKEDSEKLSLVEQLIQKHVNVKEMLGG